MLRSLLFIPGDSEKKLAKADGSGADAVILDLEDSVVPARKKTARELVRACLSARAGQDRHQELWVRINPLDNRDCAADLAAIVPENPNGIMLPKANGPDDVLRLSHKLDELEAAAGISNGAVKVLPIATETALAPFRLGEYATAGLSRLAGLTWGAEDLSTAIGASTNRSADGQLAFTYMMVRSLTLLAAAAASVQAIEGVYSDFRDAEGLSRSCQAARSEGFTGRLAIHPTQVAVINESFLPTDEEVAMARRVIAAFAENPEAGAVGIDGRMYDLPHLNQAQRTLTLFSAHRRS